jgi:TrmH family RNA methyltransferase
MITSTQNPRIKALAQLKERKGREREGLFLIEGAREVERALLAGIKVEEIFVGQLNPEEAALVKAFAASHLLPPTSLSAAALKKLSSRENPAGIIAVAQIPQHSLSAYRPSPTALVLLAVGLEKPGNLGAVLRSADAAGAEAVVAVGGVDLWNPQVIRNSTGVIFSLPTFVAAESETLGWLEAQQLDIVAATPHTHLNYWDADLRGPVALVVGPEHEGLSTPWLQAAHTQVHIPMKGQADSLNVSVSAALLLFEALRQRGQATQPNHHG